MHFLSKLLLFFIVFLSSKGVLASALEWRVQTDIKKLEVLPAYAGERTPFKVSEKPKVIKKRVVKQIEKPKELTPEQVKALRAADVLNEIRGVLAREEIFNADLTTVEVDALMSIEGEKSALIKNRWYEEGSKLDVPVAAKENLLNLVDNLKQLDESLASVVDTQVKEKIQMVKNLSLKVERIDERQVYFIDEQGNEHVIKFTPQRF